MSRFFRGKVVFVAGGSRGLGLALARKLARQGAKLVLVAREAEELVNAENECRSVGAEVLCIKADVVHKEQVDAAVAEALQRFDRIDVLINNAGLLQVGPFDVMTLEDFEQAMSVHFWAPLHLTRAVLPAMRAQKAGNIVNIASIAGKAAVPHLLPYDASKFALVGLSQGLATELARENIRVTTVCPGLMRTGSLIHALVKGKTQAEFTWMALSQATSVTSMNAERAANQILSAVARGRPEAVIGVQAKLLARANGLFPGLTTRAMSLANRMLPKSNQDPVRQVKGATARPAWLPRIFTLLNERAAIANNE